MRLLGPERMPIVQCSTCRSSSTARASADASTPAAVSRSHYNNDLLESEQDWLPELPRRCDREDVVADRLKLSIALHLVHLGVLAHCAYDCLY